MRQIGMGVSTEAKAEDIIETLKAENEALKAEAAKAKKAKE
jgi:prefoldin subunit 5